MKQSLALTLFACCAVALADSADTTQRCERLAKQADVRVVFEDRQAARDERRGVDQLGLMSRSGANRYHHVLGLTRAEHSATLELSPRFVSDAVGGVCALAGLTLKLGFSVLEVHLAHELGNPCRRAIVEEHEMEHVAAWRNHLRASARLPVTTGWARSRPRICLIGL